MKSLEQETAEVLATIAEFLKGGAALHGGALITDSDTETAAETVARLAGSWRRKVVEFYECPPCGKNMSRSALDTWVCPTGHMRKTHELDGMVPWKDAAGTWHDLELRSQS